MELELQMISNDKTVRSDTVQYGKEFTLESLATQAKKEDQLVSMRPAIEKASDLVGDNIVEVSTEHESSENNRFIR